MLVTRVGGLYDAATLRALLLMARNLDITVVQGQRAGESSHGTEKSTPQRGHAHAGSRTRVTSTGG
eukprot:10177132-Alexandrium_andersonii.AAC.1